MNRRLYHAFAKSKDGGRTPTKLGQTDLSFSDTNLSTSLYNLQG
jgi:hypothetical protein